VHAAAPHLATDKRWPRYAPIAVAAGIEAQAAVRLFDADKSSGALNLYAKQAGSFTDLGAIGQFFSHQAAIAIDYAREITDLKTALTTRQLIGQAVGIVMAQYDLDEARAFAFLTRLSSTSNTKLRLVAEQVVLSRSNNPAGATALPTTQPPQTRPPNAAQRN
jgi:hypothetical protein